MQVGVGYAGWNFKIWIEYFFGSVLMKQKQNRNFFMKEIENLEFSAILAPPS